jgi:hypothetical protein
MTKIHPASRRPRRGAALLGGALLLSGCAGGGWGGTSAPTTGFRVAHDRDTAVAMLLEGCPVSDGRVDAPSPPAPTTAAAPFVPPAALALALVPLAVDIGMRWVGDTVTRLQEERSAIWRASGLGALPSRAQGCLVVVRGRVGSRPQAADGEGAAPALPPAWDSLPASSNLPRALLANRLGLVAPPDFYMEARLGLEAGQVAARGRAATPTQLTLRPQVLHFARTAAQRDRDGEKNVVMVVALRGAPTDATTRPGVVDGASGVFVLDFGRIEPGTEILPTPRDMADPSPTLSHPFANLAQTITLPAGTAPRLNMVTLVAETAEPNRALAFLAEALEENGPALETALVKVIQDALAARQAAAR